ncbi:MAG: dimethylsulfoniopropionate demethylase [Thiolinea sp.]
MPQLSISRRTRSTPFTSRVEAGGVKAYTVYNHMLLPTVFRSVEEDYAHLCEHVQVWDVSCERQIQITGPDANRLVQWMTPRDISKAQKDQCFYLPLCDEQGRLINDPVGINVDEQTWWLSIADSDVLLWAKGLALGKGLNVSITEPDVWPVAVQGPKAERLMQRIFGDVVAEIRFFRYKRLAFQGHEFIVARSGWSKQGGFEIYVDDAAIGQALWDELFRQGGDLQVGHGCPNLIERIESGLLSFGNDMDYRHTPLQCGLDKYCHLDADLDSMSLPALREQHAAGVSSQLMGVVVPGLAEPPENPHILVNGLPAGEVYSHSLSGKYDAWLGLVMMDAEALQTLKAQPEILLVHDGAQHHSGFCAELPFAFVTMNLKPRQPANVTIAA